MRLSIRTGNSAAVANLNRDSVTRRSASAEIAAKFVLSPRGRNDHRVRRSFVLRLFRCREGHNSSAWRIHMTANILVHQFLSTAAFCFQAIQFEVCVVSDQKRASPSQQKQAYTKSDDIQSGLVCYMCGTHPSQTWTKLHSHVDQLR